MILCKRLLIHTTTNKKRREKMEKLVSNEMIISLC